MLVVKTWRPASVSSLWLKVGHRLPFNGSSSGHALLAALPAERLDDFVEQERGDHGLTRSRAQKIRKDAGNQLNTTGFVIADPAEYYTPSIHAVSVSFHPRDLGEPVVFSCGAVPKDLTVSRMNKSVGPALKAGVNELERIMGQGPGLIE